MSVHLYLAPGAAGKTAYVLDRARQAAARDTAAIRVLVPTGLQAQAWRHRLADAGGSLGVRVQTFDQFYADILPATDQAFIELSEPVQYRLLQAIVVEIPLIHYAALTHRPGFIHLLQELIRELKAARIHPDRFASAVATLGNEARLTELAQIYTAYQQRLQAQRWADRAGLGWLAVEALETAPSLPTLDNSWLVVDGFDNFTEVQIGILTALTARVETLLVTLTGTPGASRSLVHRRFNKTRQRLEQALRIQSEPLPADAVAAQPILTHLEANLFEAGAATLPDSESVTLIEAPDRAAEVRVALRWLKTRRLQEQVPLAQMALLARAVTPYRPFITQIAREFGLPVHIIEGEPLRSNPAIAALLDLLRLMLPATTGSRELALPYRLVIEAWGSPYFDWSAHPAATAVEIIGIESGDANRLQAVARYGQVIGGYSQWIEALSALADRTTTDGVDDEAMAAAELPSAEEVRSLQAKFQRFVQRLTPPSEAQSYRDFVQWLETLIGPDPDDAARYGSPAGSTPTALNMVARARAAAQTSERDIAALQTLKEVLRGLVWAEQAINLAETINVEQFFADLGGAIEATSYTLPVRTGQSQILVADVIQARGVPLRAVAVVGLAEGEFPAVLGEDPLLRNADRLQLNDLGLALELPTDSAEVEFFYETITRPWEKLLLTRPRLADNGSLWQASPYWEEVRRLVAVQPETLTGDGIPTPDQAASWGELLESLSADSGHTAIWQWVQQVQPARRTAMETAAGLFTLRQVQAGGSPFDGDLRSLAAEWATRFGPNRPWSASRLESYRTCPFMFFVGRVLNLEPRAEPGEGLDARQLGNIYHRIFEQVYQAAEEPTNLDQLLAALPPLAEKILNDAPQREGFRATAWWAETRREIVENVETSLRKLAEQAGEFVPVAYEQGFRGDKALVVRAGEDAFKLHGLIDRIDRNPAGEIRLIDYKTGGPSSFSNKAVQDGKKLQLPLYALAAQEALGLGPAVDGFYWHVRQAEASPFTLSGFKDEQGDTGPEAAIRTAIDKAWEAIAGARAGHFSPQPPAGGCPLYCPAAAFCWHYSPGFGG